MVLMALLSLACGIIASHFSSIASMGFGSEIRRVLFDKIQGYRRAVRLLPSRGSIASFLQYTRTFSQPVTLISKQFNAILAALDGAERIFEIIDEVPESDHGYVMLANAVKDKDGNLAETPGRTGI